MGRIRISLPLFSVIASIRTSLRAVGTVVRAARHIADGRSRGAPAGRQAALRPLSDGYVVLSALAGVDLTRPGDLLLFVVDHLEPLRDPAARAPDREQDGEHVDRHSERFVDDPRV